MFKVEKKFSTIFPGKVRDKNTATVDVCREGLGSTCAGDGELLTGFCLIAYSSELLKHSSSPFSFQGIGW